MAMTSSTAVQTLSRTAEKLIILLDYSTGLLTRVHGCVNFRKGVVFQEISDKVIEQLSNRKQEDPTANIARIAGSEVIAMKAEALENETRFCYETMSDILLFTKEVAPLIDTLVRNIMIFDLHRNTDLTTRFLGVFFNFIKIYFLASRIGDARVACYLFMLGYKEHNRKDVHDAHLVRKLLFESVQPLKVLQGILAPIQRLSDVICDAIQCVMPSFYTWTNYQSLQDGQYFSVSQQNPETFSHPLPNQKIELYNDATHLDNIGTWIIYAYMVFPEKLNDDKAEAQLVAALNDRAVVTLFRDELLDALSEYKALTNNSLKSIRVPKKTINKVIDKKVDIRAMTERHMKMRQLLRREIRGLLDLIETLPGVIPVKLPVLMGCLALARYEIFWLFTHMSLSRSGRQKMDLTAPWIPDLMYYCLKLFNTIKDNRHLIEEYYKEQLQIDVEALAPFVKELRSQTEVDKSILDNVDYIIGQIDMVRDQTKVRSLEGLRLNWYRASSDASKEPAVISKQSGIKLVGLVNPLIEHTRYYDRLDKEVDARGSMAGLWFYRSNMANIYNNFCLGSEDEKLLESKQMEDIEPYRQGRYWIVFLRVFEQAMLNVHRQRPEELVQIGEAVLSKAEAYINAATSKIEVALRSVLGQYSIWNSQIQPQTVADHLIAHQGEKRGWRQLAGFESYWPNRAFLKNLKFNLAIIGDMCAAFNEVDSLLIYNQKIYPNAYLHQLLHEFFYQEMRLLIQENQHTMVRPSRFISRLERLFRAVSLVNSYVDLDLERMIRDLLYHDFYDDSVGGVGGALGVPKNQTPGGNQTRKNDRLVHDIRDWYVGIVDSRCATAGSGAVYSPVLEGFYDLKLSSGLAPLEDYCSLAEMEALCRIIGPSGVRVIDIEIIKIGHAAMCKLANSMKDNKDLIKGQDMDKFYGEDRWKDITQRFRGLDVVCKQGVVIGSVVIFRKLLRKALFRVIAKRDGFTAQTMKTIHDRLYNKRFYNEEFSHLSLDIGIVSTFTDNVMRNVFYRLAEDSRDLWQSIPLVFGICFSQGFWRGVKYNMPLGALSNNGFALADCVHTLITIFCEQGNYRKMKLLFLGIAGRSLLYLKKQRRDDMTVNNLFLFLNYFVSLSKDLTLHDLQTVSIPYDLIRAQFVRIYGDESGFKTEQSLTVAQTGGGGDDDVKDPSA